VQRIAVIGGGFAGFWAVLGGAREREDRGAACEIVLISREPELVLRPRLYERAAEALAIDVRPQLAAAGVELVCGEAADFSEGGVSLAGGARLPCDRVVLTAGSVVRPPPIEGFGEHGLLLDTHADALHLRRALAELPAGEPVVVIGGGFTGIELAAELADRFAVTLVERDDELARSLGAGPRPAIAAALGELGVVCRLGTQVASVDAAGVTLAEGARVAACAVIWTGGLRANVLTEKVMADRDTSGRLLVDEFLAVPGSPWLFAAGDVAAARAAAGRQTIMSCQHAMPTGCVAGHNALRSLLGLALAPFSAPTYTTCLDLGSAGAMLSLGWERRVVYTGSEAKIVKRFINGRVIAPPPAERAALLAAAALPAPRSEAEMGAFFEQLIRSEQRAGA